ncbi:MAG: transporter substrate-binding domain-containing protein [Colwellia sp.]
MKLHVLFFSYLLSASALATEVIKVGIYDFPPYVFLSDNPYGITVEMIDAMNKFQNQYEFVAVPTTARRRYRDFENNKFDMMIFESMSWGWGNYPMSASQAFESGKEVYVTQAKPGRGQDFFSEFKNKSMVGVLGYHYQFTGFHADQVYLEKNFSFIQTKSQQKSLELILNNRGEIAILSNEYLNYHFIHSPEDKAKLLISEKLDQVYRHTILVRKKSKLSLNYINKLLVKMKKKGTLKPLWKEYSLDEVKR